MEKELKSTDVSKMETPVKIKDLSIEGKLIAKCDYLTDGIKNTRCIEALELIVNKESRTLE